MTEDEIWEKRFRELAKRSYDGGCYTFTPFLGPDKLALFYRMEKELSYAGCCLSGGVEGAERQVVRFGDVQAFGYEADFPIVCLLAEVPAPKFAEKLTHRDFLGALMNLGIERELIGDIVVGEKSACIFCLERIAGYLVENLTKVRHTGVRLTVSDVVPETAKPRCSEEQVIVSSERIDALVAKLYHLSRSGSAELFAAKKIFVGGRQCENAGYLCKDGDIVSVRGYGKFVVCGDFGVTGKGRIRVTLKIYR
ncbi:MAG: YlmH/Sll1252 family protein [bacterium]|nr:YlmH/Sll1252 family protein [bacterium]